MFLNGVILLATMALLTPFLQILLGYPVLTSGYLLGARGIGTLLSMMVVGRLLNRGVEPRGLMLVGWSIATYALWQMSGWNAETPASLIIVTSITQGAGLGLVFVPLQTVGYSTLAAEYRTHGAAMWTLIRNIGSSVGISLMIANLVNNTADISQPARRIRHAVQRRDEAAERRGRVRGRAGPRRARRAGHPAGADHRLLQQLSDHGVLSLVAFPLIVMFQTPKAAPTPSWVGDRSTNMRRWQTRLESNSRGFGRTASPCQGAEDFRRQTSGSRS